MLCHVFRLQCELAQPELAHNLPKPIKMKASQSILYDKFENKNFSGLRRCKLSCEYFAPFFVSRANQNGFTRLYMLNINLPRQAGCIDNMKKFPIHLPGSRHC